MGVIPVLPRKHGRWAFAQPVENVDKPGERAKGGCRSIRPSSRIRAGQRQRVVIRKPLKAIPKPTRMFHEPSAATGSAPWLT